MKRKLLILALCITLICAITLLCSCTGGQNTDDPQNNNSDVGGGKYPDGDDPYKPDDKEKPGDGDGAGGGSSNNREPDLSGITADNFRIDIVYNEDCPIGFWCDGYAGTYTEGALYLYEASLRLCFDHDGETESYTLGYFEPALSSDSDRLVDNMSCYVSASTLAELVSTLLGDFDADDLEDAIEDIFDDAFRSYADVSDASLDKFMSDTFGMSQLRTVLDEFAAKDLQISYPDGYLTFDKRGSTRLDVIIDSNDDGYYDYYTYVPYSAFDEEGLNVAYIEYNGESFDEYYDFYIADHMDMLEGIGLTLTDDGVLVDEKFCEAFGYDDDADYFEQGIHKLLELELTDGSYQPVDIRIYPSVNDRSVRYTLNMPETVTAPLNFEEGSTYTFDVDVSGQTYSVTVKSSGTIYSYNILTSLPQCLQDYGYINDSEGNQQTKTSFTIPDRVVFTAEDIPTSNEVYVKLIENGSFTFYYGEETTVAKYGSYCGGLYYNDMLEDMDVVGSEQDGMYDYFTNSSYAASDTPLVLECEVTSGDTVLPVTANITLVRYIRDISVTDDAIGSIYYIGDELKISSGAVIYVNGYSKFDSWMPETLETVPLTADMITGFDSSAVADGLELTVTYGDLTTKKHYTVKLDTVVSIKLNPFFWSFHVIDTTVDLSDSYITATYESGKVVENIPATLDQLSEVPTVVGLNSVTVTYEGCTQTVNVTTVKAKSAKVYEGLSGYYLIGEKPVEVILRVEFEANDFDMDYDYIVVPASEYESFDTTAAGNKTWNYTYAGIEVQHKYEVLSAAYVGYTVKDNQITIDGIYTSIERVPSLYYTMTTLKVLEIPAEIDGVPVTKIAASAFEGMNMIEELTIPDSVTEIGNYAFRNATALKIVKIPSAATLGTKILAGCTKIESLYIGGAYSFLSYFDSKYPTEATVYINEGVTELCTNFIENITEVGSLKKLVLPTTLTKLCVDENEVLAWELYRLRCIGEIAAAEGGYFSVVDGILFANYGKILYYYPQSKTDTSYTIPAGVESVVYFGENEHIKSVTVPASVTELGDYVFYSTISLETIVFEGSLNALPYGCFGLCESLVNFTFPKGITSIGDNCFEYTAIKSLVIPKGVTYVGYNAFYMMKSLERLAVPSSAMESFQTLTFQYLSALKEFAYDGSCYIKDIGAIYNMWEEYSATRIYVYDTASFEGGLSARTGKDMKIYVDASVKSITNGMVDSNGTEYYCEASSLTSNAYSSKTTYNKVFSHWYDA